MGSLYIVLCAALVTQVAAQTGGSAYGSYSYPDYTSLNSSYSYYSYDYGAVGGNGSSNVSYFNYDYAPVNSRASLAAPASLIAAAPAASNDPAATSDDYPAYSYGGSGYGDYGSAPSSDYLEADSTTEESTTSETTAEEASTEESTEEPVFKTDLGASPMSSFSQFFSFDPFSSFGNFFTFSNPFPSFYSFFSVPTISFSFTSFYVFSSYPQSPVSMPVFGSFFRWRRPPRQFPMFNGFFNWMPFANFPMNMPQNPAPIDFSPPDYSQIFPQEPEGDPMRARIVINLYPNEDLIDSKKSKVFYLNFLKMNQKYVPYQIYEAGSKKNLNDCKTSVLLNKILKSVMRSGGFPVNNQNFYYQ